MLNVQNLGDVITLDENANLPAFIDLRIPEAARCWTYAQMDRQARVAAKSLLRRGLSRGNRVAILSENRAEFIHAYLGIMKAGLVAVPINYKLPRDAIEYIFRDSDVRMTIASGAMASVAPTGVPLVDMDQQGADTLDAALHDDDFTSIVPQGDEAAEILYTSGSTGRPKGVPLSHRGQLWVIRKYFAPRQEPPYGCTLVVAPTYHMNGLFSSTMYLANKVMIVSQPQFNARAYLRAVDEHRCTVLTGIPTMFALLVREALLLPSLDLSSVEMIMLGSAPLTESLVTKVQRLFPNAAILNSYGTTESGAGGFGPHPQGLARPPMSIGYPMPDIEWRLENDAEPDQGVLHIKTPATMTGYLNLPTMTAERLSDGWYNTGDVMRRDRDGFFYFVGRADDMFVCGGENVYPGEVEKLLERHPDVAQVAVVPASDDIKGQIPVAFVVRRANANTTEEQIKGFALEHGPAFSHPRFVVFKAALPVATTHKIDRRSLMGEANERSRQAGRS